MPVAVGVGAVVQRSALVFQAIKLLGAAYLIFLGMHTIRERLERLGGAGGLAIMGLGIRLALTGRRE